MTRLQSIRNKHASSFAIFFHMGVCFLFIMLFFFPFFFFFKAATPFILSIRNELLSEQKTSFINIAILILLILITCRGRCRKLRQGRRLTNFLKAWDYAVEQSYFRRYGESSQQHGQKVRCSELHPLCLAYFTSIFISLLPRRGLKPFQLSF